MLSSASLSTGKAGESNRQTEQRITGVLVMGVLFAALRSYCYAQVTFVTAAMLSKNLPKSDLRIIQIGGGIRELYYYPSSTVQVLRRLNRDAANDRNL
jgi:hypothetical protein